jgi:hypothetical protein
MDGVKELYLIILGLGVTEPLRAHGGSYGVLLLG